MIAVEVAEDVRQEDDAELQRHCNPHLRMTVCHVANLTVQARDLREDVRDLAEEFRAVRRDRDLTSLAVEQVQPRLRLERLHGDRDGRLRDVQMLCRLRDVLPLADLIEIPHLYQRHPIISLFTEPCILRFMIQKNYFAY